MDTKPPSIRIEVPDELGTAYGDEDERQWVERRQRIGRPLSKEYDELGNFFSEEEAFEKGCELLAKTFTDWNLSGDEGPLAKPWGNPQAFVELMDSDMQAMLWVIRQAYIPITRLIAPEKN